MFNIYILFLFGVLDKCFCEFGSLSDLDVEHLERRRQAVPDQPIYLPEFPSSSIFTFTFHFHISDADQLIFLRLEFHFSLFLLLYFHLFKPFHFNICGRQFLISQSISDWNFAFLAFLLLLSFFLLSVLKTPHKAIP